MADTNTARLLRDSKYAVVIAVSGLFVIVTVVLTWDERRGPISVEALAVFLLIDGIILVNGLRGILRARRASHDGPD